MKTIYVTVAEFLENFGELETGRKVYDNNHPTRNIGEYISHMGMIVRFNYNGVVDTERTDSLWVAIQATPIYK